MSFKIPKGLGAHAKQFETLHKMLNKTAKDLKPQLDNALETAKLYAVGASKIAEVDGELTTVSLNGAESVVLIQFDSPEKARRFYDTFKPPAAAEAKAKD